MIIIYTLLGKVLYHNVGIETLILARNPAVVDGFDALAEGLLVNTTITQLGKFNSFVFEEVDLSFINLSSSPFRRLSEVLQANQAIRILNLENVFSK